MKGRNEKKKKKERQRRGEKWEDGRKVREMMGSKISLCWELN